MGKIITHGDFLVNKTDITQNRSVCQLYDKFLL